MNLIPVCLMLAVFGSLCYTTLSSLNFDSTNPAVNNFVKEFSRQLENNKAGAQLLDLAKTQGAGTGKTLQKVILQFFSKRDVPDGDEVAKVDSTLLADIFGEITPDQYAGILGYNIGDALDKRDILTQDNASELGAKAANAFIDSTKGFDITNPDGKLQAIIMGYEKFFNNEVGLKFSDLVDELSLDFIKEIA